MTLWAIVSDAHSRSDRLARVLADAQAAGAERVLSLGDVGGVPAIEILARAGAAHVFGNWEASGLRGLPQPYRSEVARWPARRIEDGFWAAHASPVWPDGLGAGGVVDHLRAHGLHWTELFPPLQHSPEARRAAFAALEAADVPLFFHGHTHTQEVWRQQPGGAPARVATTEFDIPADGSRWLVGVGSAGDPHDGVGLAYALYDSGLGHVALRRV
jgi:predicted phosphodiesterase